MTFDDGKPAGTARDETAPHAGEECFLAILRTADAVGQALGGTIESYGVTGQQYNVLRILRGSHPQGLPTLEIGERMIQRQPNVTRLLDRLERKDLVVRERCGEDRRIVRCWISDEGLALLARMDGPMTEAADRLFGCVSSAERKQLVELLRRLRAAT